MLTSYLEKFDIPMTSVVDATAFVDTMPSEDASLFASLFDISGGDNPNLIAKYICNAVLTGENDLNRVKAYVAGRAKAFASSVVKEVPAETVPVVYSAPVIVETAPEPEVTVTVETAPEVVVKAPVTVPHVAPTIITGPEVIVAKRGRGRPKLAETAYDRAVKIMQGLSKHDTKSVIAALEAAGIKKSSAHVYLCNARQAGVIPRV